MSTYHLSWTDTITGETSWRVERKTMPSGSYGEVGYALPDHTSFDDDTAPDTGEFRYRIRPQYLTSYGGYSNEVAVPVPAAAPATNLRLTGYGIPSQINLVAGVALATGGIKWNDITGETEYRIKWGTVSGNRPNSYTVAAESTSASLNAFLSSTGTYFLSVIGLNSSGQVESNELEIVVV